MERSKRCSRKFPNTIEKTLIPTSAIVKIRQQILFCKDNFFFERYEILGEGRKGEIINNYQLIINRRATQTPGTGKHLLLRYRFCKAGTCLCPWTSNFE